MIQNSTFYISTLLILVSIHLILSLDYGPALAKEKEFRKDQKLKYQTPDAICFTRQVLPILKTNCAVATCHNSESRMAGYVLNSYSNITERGVTPKKPEKSPIYQVLEANAPKPMPPKPHPRLNPNDVNTIKNWIIQGAKNTQCQ